MDRPKLDIGSEAFSSTLILDQESSSEGDLGHPGPDHAFLESPRSTAFTYISQVMLSSLAVLFLGTAGIDPSRFWLFLVPISFLLTAFGAGTLLCNVSHWPSSSEQVPPSLNLAVKLGGGVACLAMIFVASGLLGVFTYATVCFVPLMLVGLWQASCHVRHVGFSSASLYPIASGVVMGLFWLVAWLWGTIPPTFFDELAYHLVLPQRAIATGTIDATTWIYFSLMPHASDLMLAWGMWFDPVIGARAFHVTIWFVGCVAACGIGELLASRSQRSCVPLVVMCALASSPTLWFLATLPFAETCLTLALVTAMAVILAPTSEGRPWIILGLLLGLAASVKLSGLYWVGAGLVAAFVAKWSLRDVFCAGLVALTCVSPWWIRGVVNTGNPIYPMAYKLFGSSTWGPDNQARLVGDLPPGLMDMGWTDVLRLPLDLLQHPERFGSASDPGMLAVICLCLILFLPLIVVTIKCPDDLLRASFSITTFAVIGTLGWLLTSTTTRFLGPVLVLSLTVLAGFLLRLGPKPHFLIFIVMLTIGGWGTVQFIDQHTLVFASNNVALGREAQEEYLTKQLAHYSAATFVRTQLPNDARLLFIGETRPFYFFRSALAPSAYDSHPLEQWMEASGSVEELLATIVQRGVTHIVLNFSEFRRINRKYGVFQFSDDEAEIKDRRLKTLPSLLKTLYSKHGVVVMEVPPQV